MRQSATVIVVFAIAISASAQFIADSHVRAERADGTEIVLPSGPEPSHGFIVEFVAPPVAANAAAKTAIDYRATFTRFRNDFANILNAKRSAKTAMEPEIRREFSVVFNGVAIDAPREAIDQIRALPYVKRVVADVPMHALADGPNITLINAPKVWSSLGSRGAGVTVAIIDTGIDYTHPALGNGFGPGFKVKGGWDFVNNDADPMDDNGHGTHVSGIVAGQSETITGVAPDVSLMAYKVLGANGSGSESNVIAAIERAADPNHDGNTADHVDVANLSLGGGGNPDDPGCVAIDNASAAGVTFAIAAGNAAFVNGIITYHNIGSPGTARSAITVGASDLGDNIASFSSRGPNMKNMAIKPDVIAPGVSILSSLPGNNYGNLSGTSMASPHVAGAAALVKALHHDWTPAQVKLALMNNATFVREEIMSDGAGRIDAFAAATGTTRIDPPSISLGLAPIELPNWTATRSLHVTNSGTQSVTYTIKSTVTAGEKVTPSATSVTIPAGGATDISFNFAIDNTLTPPSFQSLTGGGQIVLTNSAVATDVHNIQFAFSKAARATVTFDRAYPDARWMNNARTSIVTGAFLDDNTSEVLIGSGSYDLVIYTPEFDFTTGAITGADLIARDAVALNKDTTIALSSDSVPHTVTFAGRTETGQTLAGNGHVSSMRILLGGANATSLSYPWAPVYAIHASDVSNGKSLLVYEALLDTKANNYYVIQHPALAGVSDDVSLTTGGSALRGGTVQLAFPAASRGDRRLSVTATTLLSGGGISTTAIVDEPIINARVFVSPDVNPTYSYGIGFTAFADTATQYTTPLLRVIDDKLVALTTPAPLPWTYSGSSYAFGLGPRFPVSQIVPMTSTRFSWTTDMIGPLGEVRVADRSGTNTMFVDTKGSRFSSVGYSNGVDVSAKGPYHLEATNNGTLYPGVNKTTLVSMDIDSTRTDFLPPTLTTMMMLDGNGALATRLEPHGSGSLLFSAADFGPLGNNRVYQQIRTSATAISYRYSGETAWRPLTATQVTESVGNGTLYRVDLANTANVAAGLVDLKFDLADNAGNTTTVTMAPAFSIGPELAPRHRASR
ncbi:MAG TPA: S8 family serine peptidase [Thermoanaerobaculia bacterium]|nr:S8 family serine peptidase [Thermoanaerobaculia bacterium]